MPEPSIRIVIADDHMVVREGLRLILEATTGFAVIGDAADGAAAVRLVGELQPDAVLMDLRMPGMNGIEAITYIKAQWPAVAVVILTTYNEDDLVIRGLQAGAAGYLLKDMSSTIVFDTIRAAARGETLLQPEILEHLLLRTTTPLRKVHGSLDLTERELEILAHVARGDRNKEIAARLKISESTIKAHLASIYGKLGVDSRASAVAVALERQMLPHPLNER